MNRLAPLIVRASARALPLPPSAWDEEPLAPDAASELAANLKLFATAWLGGVIFFGTFIA
jgi:hypothetical protein